MIEINLVPDVKQELIKAQRIRSMVVTFSALIGLASIVLVCILAFYVFAVQTARNIFADNSIKDESSKYMKVNNISETLTIQNQLNKITELNDSKDISSRVFDMLKAIIPPAPNDIKVSSISVDTIQQTITLNGQASNSYVALEIFKKSIENAGVQYIEGNEKIVVGLAQDISIKDSSYGQNSSGEKVLRFALSFKYADELFSSKSLFENSSVVITINGNVTDSYLGTINIFTAPATDIEEKK